MINLSFVGDIFFLFAKLAGKLAAKLRGQQRKRRLTLVNIDAEGICLFLDEAHVRHVPSARL